MAGHEEVILLVPGLFGFNRFGRVEYFDRVKELLKQRTKIGAIDVVDTSPAGPLALRVAKLHDAVADRIAIGANRIHLVGHSTGGVDIRLYGTRAYAACDDLTGERRARSFAKLGALVGISAPHWGTPIAQRLGTSAPVVLTAVTLLSVLAKAARVDGVLLHDVNEILRAAALASRLAPALLGEFLERLLERVLPHFPDTTAGEVRRYLAAIVSDHQLLVDLTPASMTRLNASAKPVQGDPAEHLRSFVTVAPPPGPHLSDLRPFGGIDPLRRMIYTGSYLATWPGSRQFGRLPEGPWMGERPFALSRYADIAQDGVVPAGSQVYEGAAAALVYGDHLDVVGHYHGGKHGGITVFDSGADFGDARMTALWNKVGDEILQHRELRSGHVERLHPPAPGDAPA